MTFPKRDPNMTMRRIYFYHVDFGRHPQTNERLPFAATDALRPLSTLDFDAGDAYHEADERVTCCWLDATGDPVRLRVADIRRTNLPQVEVAGALSPLTIEERAGLAEQIHVQFFPDNLVGSDSNFYGPRMSRVSQLLRAKADVDVRFLPAVRGSVIEELRRLREISLFHLAIHPSMVDDVARTDESVAGMFRAASGFGEAERLEVVLRPARYSRRPLGERVREALLALVGNPAVMAGADVFKTAGRTEDPERRELDLLKDELRVERPVRRLGDGSRALDPASVYAAIESAHGELREELERAHGMWMEAE